MRSVAIAAAALLLGVAGPALAEGLVETSPVSDPAVGYSIRPLRGWEPLPRKNPGDPTAGSEVGGWYGKKEWQGCRLEILAFGSFFDEGRERVDTVAPTPPPGGDEGGSGEGEGPPEPPAGGEEGGDGGGEGDGAGGGPTPPGDGSAPGKPKAGPATVEELFGPPPASFEEWRTRVADLYKRNRMRFDLQEVKRLKFGSDEGVLWEGLASVSPGRSDVVALAAASIRRRNFEVVAILSTTDSQPPRGNGNPFVVCLRSLRILSDSEMERARDALAKRTTGLDDEGAWAERVKRSLPKGWKYRETANYIIVYDKSIDAEPPKGNPNLVPRIQRQLEGIRKNVYEVLFPPDRPITVKSVVKITQDPEQYRAYNAPAGSAGYWSWPSRELVFFYSASDNDLTLDVLNHEAFHQYIFYSVGQVAPHSWFNEGHGDYFAGFTAKEGKFLEGKFDRRHDKMKAAVDGRMWVPLDKFLKYSQAEYYRRGGKPKEGGDVLQNYAQGWSIVYFLRTTKDPKYAGVLERYFNALKAEVTAWRKQVEEEAAKSGLPPRRGLLVPEEVNEAARGKALEAAFSGIDLSVLEKDWIDSKPY